MDRDWRLPAYLSGWEAFERERQARLRAEAQDERLTRAARMRTTTRATEATMASRVARRIVPATTEGNGR